MSRVAVVTGAARGIGAATVCGLAAAGWSVVAVDRAGDDPRIPYPLGTRAGLDEVVGTGRRTRRPDAAAPWSPTWPTPPTPGPWAPPWPSPRIASAASTPWSPWPG